MSSTLSPRPSSCQCGQSVLHHCVKIVRQRGADVSPHAKRAQIASDARMARCWLPRLQVLMRYGVSPRDELGEAVSATFVASVVLLQRDPDVESEPIEVRLQGLRADFNRFGFD